MGKNNRYQRLARMLKPASIVFVGGAALEPSIAYTRALGFDGDCFIVNPGRDQLCGVDCARSASELPLKPDLAFVAVPGAAAIDAVRDLAAAGVGGAIVNTSGFSEIGNDGAALEARLVEAAGDMPFIGPNCPGMANQLDGVGAMLDHYGTTDNERGVAVITNGGAYLSDISYSDRSLPLAYLVGMGNQANVSVAEIMNAILDDERVTAVHLHLESIRDVRRLSECALKAHQKGVPVVVVGAGKSVAGKRAAQTHTASLTSDSEIASALFARLGFVETDSASAAMETLKMLTMTPAPRGNRLALATSSGTYSVMGSDFAEKYGLLIPPASEGTCNKLQPLLQDFLVAGNPLDIATSQFWPDEAQREIFETFLSDDYDIALQIMSFPPENTWEDESWYRSAAVFTQAAQAAGLPCVFVAPTHEGLPKRARDALIELGMVPLQDFDYGMRAIANAIAWHQRRMKLEADAVLMPDPPPVPASTTTLDEAESKALLAGHGIPAPRGRRWNATAEVPEGLTYPVVLKVCDASILHKSDIGGVSLNLANAELLRFAREQMIRLLDGHGHKAKSFLIEESIHGVMAELLIGIRRVPEIGYSLTLAIGGTAVELLDDSVTLLLPCSRESIANALQELKRYPMLTGLRGRGAADLDSALDTIEAVIGFVDSRQDIIELEINPLMLRSENHGVAAADAVIRLKPQ